MQREFPGYELENLSAGLVSSERRGKVDPCGPDGLHEFHDVAGRRSPRLPDRHPDPKDDPTRVAAGQQLSVLVHGRTVAAAAQH
ncbi:hypothetical protein [uncultured Amnibacterium sp.]|uniref:hypothetical protein n=1 Tax=uncultured Amnibacterium sp. TaxID=1631851 RepID=UPI0035C9E25A